ncbi:MAG: sulfite exporter TauE/SafE family protein [Betaproteobacteria bacterium]|nr:MAG: sulfite exporter TauE/SafE family protein [Betaproteobacteria bacterium]
MSEILELITLPAIGLVIGVIVGLTGVGGGSLMTPILIGGLGIPPAVAVGTDLLFAALTKSFGGYAHWRTGNVAPRLLKLLIISSLAGAAIAFALINAITPNVEQLNQLIRSALGTALFLTAAALLARPWLLTWRQRGYATAQHSDVSGSPWPTLLLGAGIGAVVTISSIGAGAIGVTALLLLHPALRLSRVVGTDIAYAVPLTAAAGLAHAAAGHVDMGLLIGLLTGSIPGILLGARLSSRIPELATRSLLVGLLGLAGAKLVA